MRPTVKPRAIEVRIGELVLDGIALADAQRVGGAVERELSRLLAEGGVPGHLLNGKSPEVIDAGAFEQPPSGTPPAIGGALARAVYGGLER